MSTPWEFAISIGIVLLASLGAIAAGAPRIIMRLLPGRPFTIGNLCLAGTVGLLVWAAVQPSSSGWETFRFIAVLPPSVYIAIAATRLYRGCQVIARLVPDKTWLGSAWWSARRDVFCLFFSAALLPTLSLVALLV